MSSLPVWQQQLRRNFTQWNRLADFLELSEEQRSQLLPYARFALNLPYRLAEKIPKKSLTDPIFLQFVPVVQETVDDAQFCSQPVQDECFTLNQSLLKKYSGRALILCTSACAMHCRYCFRQNYPYENAHKAFEQEINLIAQDSTLHEVILSGGDPLSLTNSILKPLLEALCSISHVKVIRFHTRYPIGIPERIDEEFLAILNNLSKPVWFVIHSNHAREFDQEILDKLTLLRKSGVILLNQSVLLQGVNDSVDTLYDLCKLLISYGISPYYLHQLDRVRGAAHFEVPIAKGQELIRELRKRLPGYAIPRYVSEIPGEPYKTPLG